MKINKDSNNFKVVFALFSISRLSFSDAGMALFRKASD